MLSKKLLSTLGIAIAFCFLVGVGQKVFAQNKQEPCGFDHVHKRLLDSDPAYKAAVAKSAARWAKVNQNDLSKGGRTEDVILRIPLVVHVMHLGEAVGTGTNICDEQILSAVKALNEDYRKMVGTPGFGAGADTEIEFYLAVRDPMGNATNGINRVNASGVTNYAASGITEATNGVALKALSKWDNTKYYNIWLVSQIEGNGAGAGTQGYAYFPGASSNVDGAVILYNAFGTIGTLKSFTKRNGTATHELGHGLNLQHTFNGDGTGSTCPTETSCGGAASGGDEICDTPLHRRDDNGVNSNCVAGGTSCSGAAMGDIRTNYMNYRSETCYSMFTAGQVTRMRNAINNDRASLLTSTGGNPVTTPVSNFVTNISLANVCSPYPATISVCAGSTIQFYDRSTQAPTSWAWTFAGGSITNSTAQNPSVTYSTPGNYTVTLTATNGLGAGTTVTKTAHINVYANAVAACTPVISNVANFGYGIYNVTLGSINNTTTNANGYTNSVCGQLTTLTPNTNYSLSIKVGRNNADPGQEAYYRVWIDYNNDGVFNNTNELILSGTKTAVSQETFTQMFTTPMSPTANTVLRMRVANDQASAPSNSCAPPLFTGEVEDYGVIFTSATPTITLSAAALTAFTSCAGTASTNQSYTVSGSNLSSDIVITRPNANFEISTSAGSGFTNTLTLMQSSGTVNATTIYVRQTSGATTGASGNITHTSTGATQQDKAIPVSTVNTPPTIDTQPTAQTICAGSNATFTVAATGTGLTYQWQERVGLGVFTDITNGGVYSGATTATLTLTAATTGMSNNRYRCIVSTCTTSTDVVLTVNPTSTPTVSITPMSAIAGSQTFTATANNVAGGTVNYDFQKNSVSQQSGTGTTWNAIGLVAGDVIRCVITVTGGTCLTTTTATSNTVTVTAVATPTITLSAAALTAFTSCAGTASANQSYTVSGSNLSSDIVITRPNANFEISTSAGSGFTNTLTLTQTLGTVNATTIYVRQTSGATTGASGNITHTSTGATQQDKAIPASTVTATSTPTVSITPMAAVAGSQTFTATANNIAGGTVTYDFQKNSVSQQSSTGTTWNATGLVAGDVIRCVITVAGGTCLTTTTATSNTVTITAAPTITLSVAALTAFTSCAGTASANQSYTVSGSNLSSDIVITRPNANFEISTSAGSGFTNTLTLTQTLGTVNATTIYVRQTSAATTGASGDITHTSTSANNPNKAIPASTVTATSTPTVSITPMAAVAGSQTFTATANNIAGGTVTYDFQKNSASQQSTASTTWNATGLVAGDVIRCVITVTGGTCLTSINAISNTVTITAAPTIIYVRPDGNDTNNGLTDNAAGAKLTLQGAFTAVGDGNTVVLNAGTYNETATLTGKSITFQGVGNPTVQTVVMNGAGKTLTLSGNVNISEMVNVQAGDLATGGNLTLLATATKQAMLIQSATTNVNGDVNVQRYLRANAGTASLGYRFMSSSTSNATFAQLSELNPVVNADFNTSTNPGRVRPFPTLYTYDATRAGDPSKTFTASPSPDFDKGWTSPAALTENMGVGRGYTVNTSANQVAEITGTVNNGNVSVPIVTGNVASSGYNLVGNPYPSPISWTTVLAASTGVNNAIYQNMATGQYTGSWASFIAGVGTNGATDDIAVMQGFFVIANAGGSVNFTNAARATSYKNPSSFRTEDNKNASKNQGLLRLAMINSAGKTDETVVYFTDKATQNFDSQYDAVKFQLNGGNFPNIYTTDNKTLFSINALPQLNDDLIIPITVQSWTEGVQKIAMTEKLNFTREVQVLLKDKSNGKLHDLSKGGFEFSMSAGVLADRFELIFKPQFTQSELNGDILSVYPNPTSDKISISMGDDYKGTLTLRLTDVSGREIWVEKTEKSGKIYQTSTSLENLASGTYFLEVEGSKKVVKKIVKN